MVLVIDNYDSFTFNLVELIRRETEVVVLRNDDRIPQSLPVDQLAGIMISPGPGKPVDSGISRSLIQRYLGVVPVLGICLGHQLIGEMFGANVIKGLKPMHGKTSEIIHDGKGIFRAIPSPSNVMRYHSLMIEEADFPEELEVSAKNASGEIMGIRHKFYNLAGVQFHPESILTQHGDQMIQNWLRTLPTAKDDTYDS